MYLAFTSFAVRMLQGRDIMKTSASALNPQTFLELCRRFGASGAQIDFSQVPVDNMSSLAAIRQAYERAGIEVEVSIPSRYLETPEAFAQASCCRSLLRVPTSAEHSSFLLFAVPVPAGRSFFRAAPSPSSAAATPPPWRSCRWGGEVSSRSPSRAC